MRTVDALRVPPDLRIMDSVRLGVDKKYPIEIIGSHVLRCVPGQFTKGETWPHKSNPR